MALIVETGAIITNADAYISNADANTYLALYGKNTVAWDALSSAAQDVKIRQARQYMDNKYYWKGYQATAGHDTQWPRTGIIIEESLLDNASVPSDVGYANAILAVESITSDLFKNVDTSSVGGSIKVSKGKVGPLEDEIEYFGGGGKSKQIKFTEVDTMLRKYINSGNIIYGERA